ncbi:ACT domain-containing protein [Paraherbaspirillum soli]|uniref:ACT domain-containing protein n=1 Tax=Paraherbaspirillum soli TaxID=631222 RepID=A0ABW0MCJ3_9BURK
MKAIKLITQDRLGLMAEIAEILAQQHINIDSFGGKTVDHLAVMELVVDRPDEAMHVLIDKGFQAVSDDLITIRIDDRPGALAQITRELTDAKLSIRGISTLQRQEGHCFVALSTDNDAVARKLLQTLAF